MTRDLAERRGLETEVYGAAEDSALLADAAVETVEPGWTVLDCGTGSGHVGGRVAERGARVIASDLNPHACERARDRGLEAVRGDLLAPFRRGVFDAVAFNPPYLPTDPEAEWDDWMEVALSGGESGRAVIEPFLDSVGRVLAPEGIALLLVSSLTGFETVVEYAENRGFEAGVVAEESFPFETLSVLELAR
ncbi:HemK2/MTQ2 family protein methyltransferase [Halalkalicoccus sp. NIPERK01]|uniref:HemK2/MTQ2 family protein methyltransferase n=1 Tax=Halalkalicoccus sp. NIPERK01 TaxID=3053469 RepID=UPI00256EE190|nr:class I SAM-dependent methyltransferase [Halalkalicoccus sp. NIPERK01]